LIREYLDFYRLDYSKQIFMPETNLSSKKASSREELAGQSGLDSERLDSKKPLLLQIFESFQAGGGAQKPAAGLMSSPEAAPGADFDKPVQAQIQPLSIGL
jgi:hypothetical protein